MTVPNVVCDVVFNGLYDVMYDVHIKKTCRITLMFLFSYVDPIQTKYFQDSCTICDEQALCCEWHHTHMEIHIYS